MKAESQAPPGQTGCDILQVEASNLCTCLLSPSSLCSLRDTPVNLRDEMLKQAIQLYSKNWLTKTMQTHVSE